MDLVIFFMGYFVLNNMCLEPYLLFSEISTHLIVTV